MSLLLLEYQQCVLTDVLFYMRVHRRFFVHTT